MEIWRVSRVSLVDQAHRRYRIDTKLKALLPRHRFSIDKKVEDERYISNAKKNTWPECK